MKINKMLLAFIVAIFLLGTAVGYYAGAVEAYKIVKMERER